MTESISSLSTQEQLAVKQAQQELNRAFQYSVEGRMLPLHHLNNFNKITDKYNLSLENFIMPNQEPVTMKDLQALYITINLSIAKDVLKDARARDGFFGSERLFEDAIAEGHIQLKDIDTNPYELVALYPQKSEATRLSAKVANGLFRRTHGLSRHELRNALVASSPIGRSLSPEESYDLAGMVLTAAQKIRQLLAPAQ